MRSDDTTVRDAAELFALLGNETRLAVLQVIGEGERCVHEIAEELDVELSNISHHLQRLRDAGVVAARKEGRHKYYSVRDDSIATLVETGVACAGE